VMLLVCMCVWCHLYALMVGRPLMTSPMEE